METNNKLKAKMLMFSILSAFYPGVFADENDIVEVDTKPSSDSVDQSFSKSIAKRFTDDIVQKTIINDQEELPEPNENFKKATVIKTSNLHDWVHPNERVTKKFIENLQQGIHLVAGEIDLEKPIGEGGFGVVFKVNQEGNVFICKQSTLGKSNRKAKEMMGEFYISQQLMCALNQYISNPKNRNIHGIIQGFTNIVPSIGLTNDGIIQGYANGMDLLKSPASATKDNLFEKIRNVIDQDNYLQDVIGTDTKELLKILVDETVQESLAGSVVQERRLLVQDLIKKAQDEMDNSEDMEQLWVLLEASQGKQLIQKINEVIAESRCDFFNLRGFPRDPQQAVKTLCGFFYALTTLHALGFVHCDIKIENIILTIYNILKLIDLGGLSHFGQEIYVHSSNGAPETVYAHLLGIPEMHKAQPAYDIYCSAVIILSCLFGQAGVDAARQYFYVRNAQDKTISGRKNAKAKLLQTTEDILELKRNETRAKLPVYIRYLADHGFRNDRHNLRTQFFENLLNSLNNRMGQPGPNGEIHKNYPPHVLYVITKLLLRITSINPQDRPSAIEILEILQDLALSDWDNEKYLIDNLGKDLPTVDFDTDWLKENPFKIPTQQQRY